MIDWREIHAYLAGQAAARSGRPNEADRRYDAPNLRAAYQRGYAEMRPVAVMLGRAIYRDAA